MELKPRVSVIIPVYNGEKTLKGCLACVLNQTYENYEVIVIDNNSTDKTKNIIEEFQKKNKKIEYVFEKYRSVGAARNSGIRKATGEILVFIDSDCTAPKDWIEELTEPIRCENENVTLGFQEDLVSNYWTKNIQEADERFFRKNLKGNYINALDGRNFAIKSPLIKRLLFDPQIRMFDDFDLYMRLRKITKIRFVPCAKVGHYHKSSFKKVAKMNFIRGFWTMRIYKKYKQDKEIKKEAMFGSISFKNFISFPFWMILQFIKKPIGKACFILMCETSWRIGLIWGMAEK